MSIVVTKPYTMQLFCEHCQTWTVQVLVVTTGKYICGCGTVTESVNKEITYSQKGE